MTVPVCSICAWRDTFEFSYRTSAERLPAAEQSRTQRSAMLVETLNDPTASDGPFARRVESAVRMYAGTPGVTG